jgi:hypothetical protein
MRISTFVIMAIIRIMVVKYFRSYLLTKAEYCVGYWFLQAESICTYKGQVLEQKYCESSMVCVPPFWLTPLQHRRQVFDPPQVSDEDDTDPHIRAKVYIR